MTPLDEVEKTVVQPGPGNQLRFTRVAKQLSQETVAEQLRLGKQSIIDIENDAYDHFPAQIFVRGYLRAYARLVNVDEVGVMDSLDKLGIKDKKPPRNTISTSTPSKFVGEHILRWSLIGISIIVLAVLSFWVYHRHEAKKNELVIPSATTTVTAPAPADITNSLPLVLNQSVTKKP